MSFRRFVAAVACCLPLLGASETASAVTVPGFDSRDTCSISDVSSATACIGIVVDSGDGFSQTRRDSAEKVNANEFFGHSDWERISRVNARNGNTNGTGLSGDITESTSGSYSIIVSGLYGDMMLVLKSGRGYAAYYVTSTIGSWTTNGLVRNNGDIQDLRFATLYARAIEPEVGAVSLPAGGLMLLTGLAFLGYGAHHSPRRKTA